MTYRHNKVNDLTCRMCINNVPVHLVPLPYTSL